MQQQFDAVVAQLTGGARVMSRTQSVTDAIATAAPTLQVWKFNSMMHRAESLQDGSGGAAVPSTESHTKCGEEAVLGDADLPFALTGDAGADVRRLRGGHW